MLRTDFESQVQGLALDMHESRFASLLPDHDAVILSDYGKGGLDRIAKIIAQGRTFGKPILSLIRKAMITRATNMQPASLLTEVNLPRLSDNGVMKKTCKTELKT